MKPKGIEGRLAVLSVLVMTFLAMSQLLHPGYIHQS